MKTRLWPILRKEFIHIIRDPRSLAIMFAIPIVQLILLGYAVTTDIRHMRIAVLDGDRTPESRDLINAYRASDLFVVQSYVSSEAELARQLDRGDVRGGIIIPAGYGDDLARGQNAQVAFLIDGSDPTSATTIFAASQSVGQALGIKVVQQRLGIDSSKLTTVDVRPRVLYNPELKSSNYMIPALIGLILQYLTILFTALSIVREREQGTIEQLVVTPIRSWELVIGKILPYVVVSFFDLAEIMIVGVFWFGVPMRGSVVLLALTSILFLLTTLGQGLLISTIAKSQMEAIMLTFLVSLPAIFLSGFLFPLEAMPGWLQAISYAIPLRYMLIMIRAIVLKGAGLEAFGNEVLTLAAVGLLILVGASMRFRKSLE